MMRFNQIRIGGARVVPTLRRSTHVTNDTAIYQLDNDRLMLFHQPDPDKLSARLALTKRRRGATAVEMAIVAPLFFLFAFALIEFGRIGLVKQALSDAARAGCRKAVLATTLDQHDVDQTVRAHLQSVLADPAHVQECEITTSPSDLRSVQRGTEITTTVSVKCSDVSWIAPRYGDNVMIRSEATMKRE